MLGGHAVAQCLRNEGVGHVFCVPGESYIAVLDGLYAIPEVQLITNRQEGAACFMAEGYAKSTRQPGVCLVTRGPGATNASIAIHSAKYDSTPLVLLIGQVSRSARGREAGQEIDYPRFFGSIAKWVVEINDSRHVPRVMTRAFHLARSGRPGPVVVSLPRDMLEEDRDIDMTEPYPPAKPGPDPELIEEMHEKAGVQFYTYETDSFSEHAQRYLDLSVSQEVIEEIVAIVNDEIITLSEVRADDAGQRKV